MSAKFIGGCRSSGASKTGLFCSGSISRDDSNGTPSLLNIIPSRKFKTVSEIHRNLPPVCKSTLIPPNSQRFTLWHRSPRRNGKASRTQAPGSSETDVHQQSDVHRPGTERGGGSPYRNFADQLRL